jgi:hypothetical protein
MPPNDCVGRRLSVSSSRKKLQPDSPPPHIQRRQKRIRERPPAVGMEPQQVAVAGDAVQQFEAGAAAGRGESLGIFADQGLAIELVVSA